MRLWGAGITSAGGMNNEAPNVMSGIGIAFLVLIWRLGDVLPKAFAVFFRHFTNFPF
jgi:hypothetical protein